MPLKGLKDISNNMSRKEFDEALKMGRQLMILDNLVIDVTEFINEHPGGRFVMQHNVGEDISKFFFGGYCLEGNLNGISPGHKHSAYARLIVNDLAIAIYEREIPTTTGQTVVISKEKSMVLAPDIMHVVLETQQTEEAFRSYYDDDRLLGKHFRVEWCGMLEADRVNRHYTISNTMNPKIYDTLVNALQTDSEPDSRIFSSQPSQFVRFTLKNYKQPKGLSFRLFDEVQEHPYLISGPFGKGLGH